MSVNLRPYDLNASRRDISASPGYSSDPELRRQRLKHLHHGHKSHTRSRSRSRVDQSTGLRRRTSDKSRSDAADGFIGAAGGGLIGDLIFPGLGTVGGALAGWIGGKDYGEHRKSRVDRRGRSQYEREQRFYGDGRRDRNQYEWEQRFDKPHPGGERQGHSSPRSGYYNEIITGRQPRVEPILLSPPISYAATTHQLERGRGVPEREDVSRKENRLKKSKEQPNKQLDQMQPSQPRSQNAREPELRSPPVYRPFADSQKQGFNEKKRIEANHERTIKPNDLSQSSELKSPVPQDSVAVLAKGSHKQEEIIQKAKEEALSTQGTPTSSPKDISISSKGIAQPPVDQGLSDRAIPSSASMKLHRGPTPLYTYTNPMSSADTTNGRLTGPRLSSIDSSSYHVSSSAVHREAPPLEAQNSAYDSSQLVVDAQESTSTPDDRSQMPTDHLHASRTSPSRHEYTHGAPRTLYGSLHIGDASSAGPRIDAAPGAEVQSQRTHDVSDGEISFIGGNPRSHDLGPFRERVEQQTLDFVLELGDRVAVRCHQDDRRPWPGCSCCHCSSTQHEKAQTVSVSEAHESQDCDKNAGGSTTAAASTQASWRSSHNSNTKKRPHPEEDDDDTSNQKREPPAQGNDGSSPGCEETSILACPYHKFDPLRYSSHNIREKEYRGCSSSFLRDIPRLKQHLYRVHRRPDFCCSRCSERFETQDLLNSHSRQDPPCRVAEMKYRERMDHSQYLAIKRRQVGTDSRKQWYHIFRILFPSAPEPDSPYATAASTATVSNEVSHFANLFRYIGPDVVREMLNERQQLVERNDFAPLDISTSELVEETFHVAFPLYQQAVGETRNLTAVATVQVQAQQAESSATTIHSESPARSVAQPLAPPDSPNNNGQSVDVGAEVTPPEESLSFDDFLNFTVDTTEAYANYDPFASSMLDYQVI